MYPARAVLLFAIGTTGDFEKQGEVNLFAVHGTGRGCFQQAAHIEHLVVKTEFVGGNQVEPASFWISQCVLRNSAPARVSFSRESLPLQNASVARLSSRRAPMRGKPRLCVVMACPPQQSGRSTSILITHVFRFIIHAILIIFPCSNSATQNRRRPRGNRQPFQGGQAGQLSSTGGFSSDPGSRGIL